KESYENSEVEDNEIEKSLLAETSDLAENKPASSTPYNEKRRICKKKSLHKKKILILLLCR
ncbi:5334_t:CDS:1, partial [Scutellospora calospora]